MPSKGLRTERDSGEVVAFGTLTVGVNAVTLASIIPARMATYAWIEVQGQPLRVRFDAAPTATVGHYYVPGQSDVWSEREFRNAQLIRDTGATGDATLVVTFYKS